MCPYLSVQKIIIVYYRNTERAPAWKLNYGIQNLHSKGFGIKTLGILNPESGIRNPESGIRNPENRNPALAIRNPNIHQANFHFNFVNVLCELIF